MARQHRHTFIVLLVAVYIAVMLFFVIIRMFGLMWYTQEYIPTSFNPIISHILLYLFWLFDGVVIMKTLTEKPLKIIIPIVIFLRIPLYIAFICSCYIDFAIELLYVLGFPLIFNKDKERTVGYSILYMAITWFYQLLMVIGRGYPMIAKYSTSWQIILTIDWRLFIYGLLLLKGVVKMDGPSGCWFFIGKFDNIAKAIGNLILHPIKAIKNAAK